MARSAFPGGRPPGAPRVAPWLRRVLSDAWFCGRLWFCRTADSVGALGWCSGFWGCARAFWVGGVWAGLAVSQLVRSDGLVGQVGPGPGPGGAWERMVGP